MKFGAQGREVVFEQGGSPIGRYRSGEADED